jgi:putative DNA primase/helicase
VGKHPLFGGWPDRATTDEHAVVRAWQGRPMANIAIRTGRRPTRAWREDGRWRYEYGDTGPGLFVLDVDPAGGGVQTLADLEADHGALPATAGALTGGGGEHRYFTFNGPLLTIGAGEASGLGPGLDFRADGGFVVAPGSRHKSGRRYQWEASSRPEAIPMAEAPAWLVALARERRTERGTLDATALERDGIVSGARNDTLFRHGARLRHLGYPADVVAATLLAINGYCRPPLDDGEVRAIAASAATYAPTFEQTDIGRLADGRRVVTLTPIGAGHAR